MIDSVLYSFQNNGKNINKNFIENEDFSKLFSFNFASLLDATYAL